ncbi:phage tail tape measure protein [Ectopseudomonas khazarica]|uniref:phage tail tape measure protein n=1 Tax=Ectopseudomonas khazarica TaxID=2502979 RepID=UPI0037C77500
MANDLKMEVILQAIDRATRPIRAITQGSVGLGRALKESRDQLKTLQAQQRDISSWRTLRTAAGQTEQSLQQARDRVKELGRQMAANGVPTRQMQRDLQGAIRAATALKREHQEQQTQLQGLRGKLNAAGISTRTLSTHERELRNRIEHTNKSIAEQTRRMQVLAQQSKRLAQARAQYDKTQQLAGSMAGSGAAGLASGSGILYAGARLLAPGLDFDASMSKVQSLTRLDKNSPELAALREQARQLGASTQFTAGQSADAQGFLAMAGFNPNAIRAAMPGMLSLAKAGDSELAETADIASNILTGFNLQASDMGRVGDVLVGAFTRSNTNLQMLGETMKYVAPVAAGVGQDIETMAAMAGKLGDAGIQGSMGGTALRAIISRLAAPPKMAADALNELGISAKDAQGNMRDMPTVLQEIYEKTKTMGDAERSGFLKGIAGEEAFSGLQVLVQQAGNGELQKFIGTLREARGEAEQTAKVMADNLRGDLATLNSAWEDLGIQLQTQQDGPLRNIAQGITRVIGGITAWVKENPALAGQLVKTAAGLGLIMATMGGLTLMLASILGPFAMVRYGMMLLGIKSLGAVSALKTVGSVLLWIGRLAMANPIGLLITALVVGAVLIYKNWDAVKAYLLGLWDELQAGFSGGLGGIAATIINFSPLGLFHRAMAGVLSYFGVDIPARFTDFGGMLMDGLVNGITAGLGRVKDAITGAGGAAIDWFKQKLGIHSPSRVFAELGGFTMQGLERGLIKGQDGPLGAVLGLGKQLVAAGAITFGAAGSAIAMDNRPPLGSQSAPRAAQGQQPAPISIHVHAAPGMDEQRLANLVAIEVAKLQRAQQARNRSALSDQE